MSQHSQTIIGWREWISLPELKVPTVKAKIDTGALSCALHAEEIELYRRNAKDYVRFTVHPLQRSKERPIQTHAPVIDFRLIKSSNGKKEKRPIIISSIKLGPYVWKAEISLTRRDQMDFRMLIGRKALRKYFLVDSGRSFLLGKPPRKQIL